MTSPKRDNSKAEIDLLVSENAHMRVNLAARAQEAVVAFHEQNRLRLALARLVELGQDDGSAPDDAWKRAWKQAAAALSTRADETEGETSEPLSTLKSE